MKVTGKIVFLSFEGGAYGIIDSNGRKLLPLNMPEQLKKEGANVTCIVRQSDAETMIMWGEPVIIESFETLTP